MVRTGPAPERKVYDLTTKLEPKPAPAPTPAPKRVVKAVAKPTPKPAPRAQAPCSTRKCSGSEAPVLLDNGLLSVCKAVPTGDLETSILLIERFYPQEVRPGEVIEYMIRVTNLTQRPIKNISLTERVPAGFNWTESIPKDERLDPKTGRWFITELNGRDHRLFRIRGTATSTGSLQPCAGVAFVDELCHTMVVVQPKLQLTKTGPAEVMINEAIPFRLVVSNVGEGVARNVQVADTLPPGLIASGGDRTFVFDVGDLAQGQSREFSLTAQAAQPGTYENTAAARGDGGLLAEASATVVVRKPVLTIEKTGSKRGYLGRPVTYTIKVGNRGDAVASNVVLVDPVPTGSTFESASDGGASDGGRVVWRLGELIPGAEKEVKLRLIATAIGTITNQATATATAAEPVSASAQTPIVGIPGVLLEVADIGDPVEIGNQAVYQIVVTNQGSAPATNITIVCELEENMTYVSTAGPTQAESDGATIRIAPLPSLSPKSKASWQVRVNAVKAGDVRFRVSLTSDQLQRPVEETESTHVY